MRETRINPRALNGSVYASLGLLYAQIAGALIAFGDHQPARDDLQRGLAMAPSDVDANFFMGALLLREHDRPGIGFSRQKDLVAPARPGRALLAHPRQLH